MKKYLTLFLLAVVSQNLYAGTDTNQAPEDYCALNDIKPALWLNCDGKMVRTTGHRPRPQEIMQHPMLDGPQLLVLDEDENLTLAPTVQSYLNVAQRQIILLSEAPIECDSEITVVGTLERVSLGGRPRTKGSYEGWSIHVSEDICL